tara:strand:+ start:6595 stop:7350 length:756 start_codon:yes stop_codon:yes gene_type:complete
MNNELKIQASWKVELVDGVIKLYNYQELFESYSTAKTYNCTVMDDLCEICGLRNPCYQNSNHENLQYVDGVFQIGFYSNKVTLSKLRTFKNDFLTKHTQNLEHLSKYGLPLSMAMYLIIEKYYPDLFEADLIVPIPSFLNEGESIKKGMVLAKNLSEIFERNGTKSKYENCLKKVTKVSAQRLAERGTPYDERFEKLTESFQLFDGVDVSGKKILLVDDILTSGLTAGICAKILKDNGAEIVWVFVAGRSF